MINMYLFENVYNIIEVSRRFLDLIFEFIISLIESFVEVL